MKAHLRSSAISYSIVLGFSFFVAFFLSSCTNEGPVGPSGQSGSSELMDPSIVPMLVSSSPADNAVGPFELYVPGSGYYLPHFVLQFNKLIDVNEMPLNSVRIAGFNRPVYVRPYSYIIYNKGKARPAIPAVNGPYDYIFSFFVYDSVSGNHAPYDIGNTYTVTIDTSLYDINGNHPARPISFSYTPEPYFRAVLIYPTNGATNINRRTEPTVYFNSKINSTTLDRLTVSPSVSGNWILNYDSLSAFFLYAIPFSFRTAYSVNVDANATDAAGHHIHAGISSSFTTGTLGISYSYPPNGSTGISPTTEIELDFNDQVDTGSVRKALSISPPVSGALYIYSTYLYLYPNPQLAPGTQYTVTLSTALKSTDGFQLETPITTRFTTAPFSVTSTSPYSQSTGVGRSTSMYIYCNGIIDTGSVRSAFHISPSTAGSLELFPGTTNFTFIPSGPLQASTLYTVTIDSTLRAVGGYTMSAPYIFWFVTGTN